MEHGGQTLSGMCTVDLVSHSSVSKLEGFAGGPVGQNITSAAAKGMQCNVRAKQVCTEEGKGEDKSHLSDLHL